MDERHGARAFGLTWSSDLPLRDFDGLSSPPQNPDIIIRQGVGALPVRPAAVAVNRGTICADGVRLAWNTEVTFDTYGAELVEWRPGPDWTGQFPPPLYSTVTALLLAWRGLVPVHASAVEIDGRGYLICGASGAGKSTLAAALIAQGARLISDDLSVLRVGGSDEGEAPLKLLQGRPGIRVHPVVGESLIHVFPGDPWIEARPPKVLIRPGPAPFALPGTPLAGIILRGAGVDTADHVSLSALWRRQVFRPRWMSVLPGRKAREVAMIQAAKTVPLMPLAPTDVNSTHDLDRLAHRAMDVLSKGLGIM